MTHDELLLEISSEYSHNKAIQALYEVVELHKPDFRNECMAAECECNGEGKMGFPYPCPTIQAIERELS